MKLPEIKKEVKDFLSEESGIISKESVIKTGIVIGGILAAAKNVVGEHGFEENRVIHKNDIKLLHEAGQPVNASHNHHANHSSFTN